MDQLRDKAQGTDGIGTDPIQLQQRFKDGWLALIDVQ